MKVLHLLPALEQGGVETVVCGLNKALAANGAESVVVSQGGRLVERITREGGRHIRLDLKSKNILTALPRALALRRILRAEKPDLVCAHSRVPAWLFVLANRPLGLKWISYAHGANSVSRYSEVMTKGDLTITPSRFLADFLKRNYGLAEEKIRVINPPIDFTRFDPAKVEAAFVAARRAAWGLGPDDEVVMAVGRLSPLKNCEGLIRAMRTVKAVRPRARLVFVGDADKDHAAYLASLRRLATESGLGEAVVFAGGETRIPEILTLASVVVSANVRKPESFGLSMAEALAMERPVVARNFGGAAEIVRHERDGILVDGAEDDFARGIQQALTRRFSGLREGVLSRYGAERTLALTLAAYTEVTSVPNPQPGL